MSDYKKRLQEIKEKIKAMEDLGRGDKNRANSIKEDYESLSDEEYFLKEMEGVKRIQNKNRIPKTKSPKIPQPTSEDEDVINTLNMIVDGNIEFKISDSAEYIEGYNVKDYDPNVLKKLKKGEIAYQSYIDLHGKTKDEAKLAVKNFIENSHKNGIRCVLIIHGKGMHSKDYIPVLKESLKSWLSSKSTGRHILAFCSAIPRDGGTGALYVLLRK